LDQRIFALFLVRAIPTEPSQTCHPDRAQRRGIY